MIKYYLHTGRGKMIEVFDKRCALINKEGACHQCTELNGIFNPKQNAQEEAVKIQMVRDAAKNGQGASFRPAHESDAGAGPVHLAGS
jgi:RNA polymerase sigma-70 factor (ECF subfamily)